MNPYIEIILEDKIYSQRTAYSKLIKFDLNGVKQESLEQLPNDIKILIDTANNMELFPNDYFGYIEKDKRIEITNIRKLDLSYVRIPAQIKGLPVCKIGPYAMTNLSSVKQIQLPETVEEFGSGTFQNLTKLEYINMSENIRKIPDKCFYGCLSLKLIDTKNIEEISANAFESCDTLKEIFLPNIKYLGTESFNFCRNLKKVEINGPLLEIPEKCFSNCIQLEDLRLPNSIKIIRFGAFQNCALPFFIAPEDLLLIERLAFNDNCIKVLHLNKNLNKIQAFAFIGNDIIDAQIYSTTDYNIHSFSSKNITIVDKQEEIER